jgi:DNA-binding transcriptional regulator YdaS (Cro superfamily)
MFSSGLDLKIAILRAGLRQNDVARQMGIAPSTLSDYISQRRRIPPHRVDTLKNCLGDRDINAADS